MKLYSFFNSSASYRVRIALALKGLDYQTVGVNIRIGQQNELAYRRMNPLGLVPTLVTDDGESLGQSLAITDWLDHHFPQSPLLPADFPTRSKVLEIVYAIACDIHPVNNMRVLRYLSEELKVSEEDKNAGMRTDPARVKRGGTNAAPEPLGDVLRGDAPTLADCCLIPQWANALRMGCDLSGYPRCQAVYDACTQLPAFIAAAPENQQDKIPA